MEIGSFTDHNIEKSMFADKWLFDQLNIYAIIANNIFVPNIS